MNKQKILVTGATGKTGSRVASILETCGAGIRRVSRHSNPPLSWSDPETFTAAIRGCNAVYLRYYPDYAFPGTTKALTTFTRTAVREGVEHLVMLVGRGESHAMAAEQTVRSAGIPTTALRSAWFAQNFSEGALIDAVHKGVIAMPGGSVREPILDLDDLAEVAARLLLAAPANRTVELTGPESLTYADMADSLSRELGRPIIHQSISFTEFYEALKSDSDETYARMVTDIAIETFDGRNESTSSDVERLLGRPPRSFASFVCRAAAMGIWSA